MKFRMTRAHIAAFLAGAREFRSDWTMHVASSRLMESYDRGREWTHRLTLRRWDQAHH